MIQQAFIDMENMFELLQEQPEVWDLFLKSYIHIYMMTYS